MIVTKEIPSDPEAYKKWLEAKRKEYSATEKKIEQKYATVSMSRIMNRTAWSFSFSGINQLMDMPSFAPTQKSYIEWTYIIDLDLERFSVNGYCHFHLSKLPRDWPSKLQEALAFRLHKNPVSDYLTTDETQPIHLGQTRNSSYETLDTTIITPKSTSTLLQKPAVVACTRLFTLVCNEHKHAIFTARDTLRETDFLFREVAFLLLCLASGSPALVRQQQLHNLITAHYKRTVDYAALIHGNNDPELVSKPFHGYHSEDKEPGMAPVYDRYWFQGVLVSLHRDIDEKTRYESAIATTVARGR
jgi:hypothetical protein